MGTQGGVTGWGFSVVNTDPDNWLVLNDSFVTGSLSTGTFGTYKDYVGNQFVVVDPNGGTFSQAFDPATQSGAGEFDLAAFVPPISIPGAINLDYTLFSQNPNDPNFDPGSFVASGTVQSAASVDVTPEPSSILMLITGAVPLVFAGRRKRAA